MGIKPGMLAVAGLVIVSVVAFGVVAYLGRSAPPVEADHPWNLAEAASRQVTILGGMGGFAVTAIVLLVTLGRSQPDLDRAQLDAVLVLFLVAWVSIGATAVMFSRPPTREGVDPVLLRLHYAFANDQHFRSIVMAWLAMVPLLLTFGLRRPAEMFALVVAVAGVGGMGLLLVVLHRLGFLRLVDMAAIPVAGIGGALAWAALVAVLPALRSSEATLHLATAAVVVNVVAFGLPAFGPVLLDRGSLGPFVERHGHALTAADAVVSVVLVTFLWLAVLGLV
jgi:hypothetical protein